MAVFFAKKFQGLFAVQKFLTFFVQKKNGSIFVNFNVSLTNDIISFEQLGLGVVCDFLGLGPVVQN